MTDLQRIQLDIMLVMTGICAVITLFVFFTNAMRPRRRYVLFSLELSATLVLIFDRIAYLFRGNASAAGWWAVRIANFAVFFLSIALVFFFNLYISDLFTHEGGLKTAPKRLRVTNWVLLVAFLFLVVSQFTVLYYTFDEMNVYHRAKYQPLCYIFPFIAIFLHLSVIIQYYKRLTRLLRFPILLFTLIPIFATVVQVFFYGFSLSNLAIIGMAVLLYVFALIDLNETVKKENDELMKLTAEKERIAAELSVAAKIQSDMLNKTYPPFPSRDDFDLFASMSSAKEVGGDLYDYLLLDDDHLMMMVGDVSGKGVGAALFMAKCKVLLDFYSLMGVPPAEMFERANNHLCKGNDSGLFVTCWLGIFCFSTRELRFVNAGHPFPVVFKKDSGSFEFLKEKPGFILGGMENVKYKEYSITLEKGERIFIYTDGVTEATNKNEELFGDERLLRAMDGTKGKSAPDTLLEIRRAIDSFAIGAEQFDDITMMSFELK